MAIDDIGGDAGERIGAPARIAVLVDDGRADALDEIVAGDAGERDAVVLLEALLQFFERRRLADVAQRDFQRGRRFAAQSGERGAGFFFRPPLEPGDNILDGGGREAVRRSIPARRRAFQVPAAGKSRSSAP